MDESECETTTPEDVLPPPPIRPRLKRWEKRLPAKFVVAATPSELSLKIGVEIETTDTGV
jgi:hypothetical protein